MECHYLDDGGTWDQVGPPALFPGILMLRVEGQEHDPCGGAASTEGAGRQKF